MITLYGLQGACSLAPHIALEEAGLPFVYQLIRRGSAEDRELLLSKNVLGEIPVVELQDGRLLTQNVAILQWIADRVPEQELLPPMGSFERATAMEWLAYFATSIHPAYGPLFHPSRVIADEAQHPELLGTAKKNLDQLFRVVERRVGAGPWFLGERYSLVDAYHFVFFRWLRLVGMEEAAYPKLAEMAQRTREREATTRALAREKVRY